MKHVRASGMTGVYAYEQKLVMTNTHVATLS